MKELAELCVGCFETQAGEAACALCGYDSSRDRSSVFLPHRTVLHAQYLVGRALGKPGGIGITYLAMDTNLETKVAIKEYLPRGVAGRNADRTTVGPHSEREIESFRFGLGKFMQEARTLAHFDHPNIVRVRTFFEENGTAYLVMDYVEGLSVAEYVDRKGGKIPERLAVDILMPVLDGLREVHELGFLHRDIKPQNIHLSSGGRPVLLDFGAARFAVGERSQSLSVVLTPGFAPWEQYHRKGEQGPWTDIYGVAATLYALVSGIVPPESSERKSRDELIPPARATPGLSTQLCQAITAGLALDPRRRPQSVREFQAMLQREEQQPAASTHARAATQRQAPPTPPRRQSNPSFLGRLRIPPGSIFFKLVAIPALALACLVGFMAMMSRPIPPPDAKKPGSGPDNALATPAPPPETPLAESQGPATDQVVVTHVEGKARFEPGEDGIICDTTTKLDWYVGPDEDMKYDRASGWVRGLTVAGGDWQMPTNDQVKQLCTGRSSTLLLDPIFATKIDLDGPKTWVWTELRDEPNASFVALEGGYDFWRPRTAVPYGRAFAVRPHK